jgi:hypothetical protein
MADARRADLQDLFDQLDRLDAEAAALVGGLGAAQLAWRPDPAAWSIAENLEHLGAIGRWYFKHIDRALDDAEGRGLRSDAPARLSWFERSVVRLAEPPVRRLRIRAPRPFQPPEGFDPAAAPAAYRELHAALRPRLERAAGLDLKRARARTPLSRRPATLLGCLSLMLAHERRHLWQARQVAAHASFPRA